MELVGVSEAARRLGVAKSTISRQVAAGVIPNRGSADRPMVDVDEARDARASQLNPLKARNRGAVGYEAAVAEADGAQAQAPQPPQQGPGLARAQAAEKALRAQLLQIDLEKRRGNLVDRQSVEETGLAIGVALREVLDNRRQRLAEQLVAIGDVGAMAAALDAADRKMLEDIAARMMERLNKLGPQQQPPAVPPA